MTASATPHMFVAGDWRQAASGETYNTTSPATGEEIGAIPQGDREDAAAAIAAAAQAADRWGRADRVRAGGQDARGRRRDRVAARRAGADADARSGQAAEDRGLRRGRRAGRVLAGRGRGRQAARRRAAQLVLARQEGAAAASRARRRRRDQPVELAVHDAGGADRARAGVRQRGRLDARADDRPVGVRAGAVHRRGRPAAGRVQPGYRPGRGGRRRDRPQSGCRRRRLHRLDPDRPARRPGRGRQGARAGDGRQRAGRAARRRRRRCRRRGDRDRLLSVRRPELHRRRADPGPPGGLRRVRREAGARR